MSTQFLDDLKTQYLTALTNPEIKDALLARIIHLTTGTNFGYLHGSHALQAHATVARSLIGEGIMSTLPLNDGNLESLIALNEFLLKPRTEMKVLRYNNVNYVGIHDLDKKEYTTSNLYVFPNSLNVSLESRLPQGNSNRPIWAECAHILEDGKSARLAPIYWVRGIDPEDVTELTIEEYLNEFPIPDDFKEHFRKAVASVEKEEAEALARIAEQEANVEDPKITEIKNLAHNLTALTNASHDNEEPMAVGSSIFGVAKFKEDGNLLVTFGNPRLLSSLKGKQDKSESPEIIASELRKKIYAAACETFKLPINGEVGPVNIRVFGDDMPNGIPEHTVFWLETPEENVEPDLITRMAATALFIEDVIK